MLAASGLDPADRALADWTEKHAREALGKSAMARCLVCMTGHPTNYVRWEVVRDGAPDRQGVVTRAGAELE